MEIRTIREADLSHKTVLMRVDFNVPLNKGKITDDTRIRAALPTINYILEKPGTRLVLMSHLGRPKGEPSEEFSLAPVAHALAGLLGKEVIFVKDCIGPLAEEAVSRLETGSVLLLENLRFHAGETKNDPSMAKALAKLGDVYVNDAFGTAHRAHASTEGITAFLDSYGGFLIEKEVAFLGTVIESPEKPFVAIIGGAKVSTKIAVLESLLPKCTSLVIGGGMAYTFLKAQGKKIGGSLCEEDFLDTASSLLKKAGALGVQVILPSDHVAAKSFDADSEPQAIDGEEIPDSLIGMDIGPKTITEIRKVVSGAKTLIWNGPMGVFEFDVFSQGTLEVAKAVAACGGTTVVGGGDSVAAVNKYNLADTIDHVSTGGGASLEFLEGLVLPGIAALQKK
ncbi:MAG: phosphoglycerate kinase [Spirochaetales bacterium]|nr:phosphoglycerate kinase [Spirochaetales bacterium]